MEYYSSLTYAHRIAQLMTKVQSEAQRRQRAVEDVKNKEEQIKQLQQRLATITQKLQQEERARMRVVGEKTKRTAEVESLSEENEKLQKMLQLQAHEADKMIAERTATCSGLQARCQEQDNHIQHLEEQLQQNTHKLFIAEQDNASLQQQLHSASQQLEQCQQVSRTTDADANQLRSELARTVHELSIAASQLDEFTTECTRLQEHVNVLQKEAMNRESELQTLQQELKQRTQRYEQQITEREDELKQVQRVADDALAARAAMDERMVELHTELLHMKEDKEKLQKVTRLQSTTQSHAQASAISTTTTPTAATAATSTTTAKTKTNTAVQTDSSMKPKAVSKPKPSKPSAPAMNTALQEELQSLKEKLERLTARLQSEEAQRMKYQDIARKQAEELRMLDEANNAIAAKLYTSEQALARSYEQLRKRDDNVRNLTAKAAKLNQQLDGKGAIEDQYEHSREQIGQLTKQVEKLRSDKQLLMEQLETARKSVDAAVSEARQLQQICLAGDEQRAFMQQQMQELVQHNEQLAQQLNAERTKKHESSVMSTASRDPQRKYNPPHSYAQRHATRS